MTVVGEEGEQTTAKQDTAEDHQNQTLQGVAGGAKAAQHRVFFTPVSKPSEASQAMRS